MVGFELDAAEILTVIGWGTFFPLSHHGSELYEYAGEKWSEVWWDQIRACVEINVVQLRNLPTSVRSARGGRTFPVVSSRTSLEMQVAACRRRPDFNKDSLLCSSALKCKLFHRALLHSNATECKMNTQRYGVAQTHFVFWNITICRLPAAQAALGQRST